MVFDFDKKNQLDHLLERGVSEIIVKSELVKRLRQGNPLRLKMGFDPSAPDLHLGHAVGLRKLRQLQDIGHKVVVIVGDWTAQIGDPSGHSVTRPMLTAEEVSDNAKTYLSQFFKIVDKYKTEVRMQSEWFGSFSLEDIIRLSSRFTIAQFLARDDFSKRFKANRPIAITELFYPLLQAYDSVAVEADVEFGGTDQKFNLLVGRELQQMMGQSPQQCFLMPLLVGTDGVQKMSKSLGNYIGMNEPPNEIYGKVMSLPDSMIISYFDYLTDVSKEDLTQMRHDLKHQLVNPMDLKKKLAHELVNQFYDVVAATVAGQYFENTVQLKQVPSDVARYVRPVPEVDERIVHIIVGSKLAKSIGDAKRLIAQGAVTINGEKIATNIAASSITSGSLIQVGQRRFVVVEYRDQ